MEREKAVRKKAGRGRKGTLPLIHHGNMGVGKLLILSREELEQAIKMGKIDLSQKQESISSAKD